MINERKPVGSWWRRCQPVLTPEEMVALYQQGGTLRAVAELAHCSITKVRATLIDRKIELRHPYNPGTKRRSRELAISNEEIIRLYVEEGKSLYDVALVAQCASDKVREILVRSDIPIRKRGGYYGHSRANYKRAIGYC